MLSFTAVDELLNDHQYNENWRINVPTAGWLLHSTLLAALGVNKGISKTI
jgi:hypothetical protein